MLQQEGWRPLRGALTILGRLPRIINQTSSVVGMSPHESPGEIAVPPDPHGFDRDTDGVDLRERLAESAGCVAACRWELGPRDSLFAMLAEGERLTRLFNIGDTASDWWLPTTVARHNPSGVVPPAPDAT